VGKGRLYWLELRKSFAIFFELEDNKNIEELDQGYHREGGLMTAMKPRYTSEIKNPLLEATAGMGYEVTDVNGARQTGIYDLQGTLRDCQRCSTAKAYLVPAKDRPNLTILKEAFATKILFNRKRAVGVQFEHKNILKTAFAAKEVIVSSGSVRAAQLLMLSGIGPKQHMSEMNIPLISDLPVGKNLQDHYGTMLNYEIDPLIMNAGLKNTNPLYVSEYITHRTGPLCSPNQVSLIAFLDGINTTSKSEDFPRQELSWVETDAAGLYKFLNLKEDFYSTVFGKYIGSTIYLCLATLTQPASRGEITLKSRNPYEHPRIDPQYYEDERDLQDVVEAMRICDAVGTSKAMRKVKSKPFEKNYPMCEKYKGNLTAVYECMARSVINTIWHTSGTCRMGQPNDPRSVVDPQGKVIGVHGLRVVCAAIMPIIPSGNTNVPTMMIAEKISDEMKKEIKCKLL